MKRRRKKEDEEISYDKSHAGRLLFFTPVSHRPFNRRHAYATDHGKRPISLQFYRAYTKSIHRVRFSAAIVTRKITVEK